MAAPATSNAPRQATTIHLGVVIAAVFAVSVLKGLRMPSLWAVTHMTFDYRHGFVRRGLFGQVLRVFGDERPYRYNFLALCAAILLLAAVAAVFLLVRRLLRSHPDDRGLPAAILVLAASPGLVFLSHEIGYLDYVSFIGLPCFILYALRARRFGSVCFVAMAISVLLALVHESMIVTFAPGMLFTLLCHALARGGGIWRRLRPLTALPLVLVMTVALLASTLVGTLGTPTAEQLQAMLGSTTQRANFAPRADAFAAIGHSLRENLLVVLPRHWSDPVNQRYLITSLVVSLPGLVFLAVYGVRVIRRLAMPRTSRVLLTAVLLTATVAPLLLNFIGWDSARWNATAFMATFSCLASLRLFFVEGPAQADMAAGRPRLDGPLTLTFAALVVVAGLCTSYHGFLFDGFSVQWFPFDKQLDSLIEVWRGGFTHVPGA